MFINLRYENNSIFVYDNYSNTTTTTSDRRYLRNHHQYLPRMQQLQR